MGTWHQKGSRRLEDLVDAFWWVGLYYTLTLTGSEGIELSHQVCGSPKYARVMDLCKNILIRRHT